MAHRETYTHDQLQQYYDRVCIPEPKRIYDASTLPDEQKLDFLKLLCKHELCKVPWENLVQHYSWHRVVNVKPLHLFRKIVLDPGRGGYCMEANFFFHTVLLSLGFNVYIAGSRIYAADSARYGGWTHCVNIVTVGATQYLLDGGFGGNGPTSPVPLEHGKVLPQIEPAQMRVMYESIPQHLDKSQRVWIFQYRYDESKDWVPMYCFTALEFLPEDIACMNFAPWLNPQTFFTHKVVVVRFTTSKESDASSDLPGSPLEDVLEAEIDGSLTINQNELKWRRHGKKTVDWAFKSEADRVEALRKYFGIQLGIEDREAILGAAAEIGSQAMSQDWV